MWKMATLSKSEKLVNDNMNEMKSWNMMWAVWTGTHSIAIAKFRSLVLYWWISGGGNDNC